MRVSVIVFLLSASVAIVKGDVYMHSPRGSNGRCDEKSNDRNNANRLYDTQNNAAGGYSVCGTPMSYYVDTELQIEWTAQHSCGNGAAANKADPFNPENNRCNVVLQVGCEDAFGAYAEADYQLVNGDPLSPVNGDTCTETRPLSSTCVNHPSLTNAVCDQLSLTNQQEVDYFNSDKCLCHPRKMKTYGKHESETFYKKCSVRNRNKNLYTSNQNVQQFATSTRQNANGANNRFGFECPEERDYYPYWHPTGWRDIAVMTSEPSRCSFYQSQSENVLGRGECVNVNDPNDPTFWAYNNPGACTNQPNGNWVTRNPLMPNNPPDCVTAFATHDNNLGLTSGRGDAKPEPNSFSYYKWRIPRNFLDSLNRDKLKCVLRIRYNISTAETPWELTKNDNGALNTNPVVQVGNPQSYDTSQNVPLRLAVNTAQYFRTFEDRTEPFYILARPSNLSNAVIHNLNVRGKRGNIAQVRNCVEYDFVPNILNVKQGDYVHFQWCGSDYNDPNNDGNGIAGTDRSNIVPIPNPSANLPLTLVNAPPIFSLDDYRQLAWLNQTNCYSALNATTNLANANQDPMSCHYLNAAPVYYNQMAQVVGTGTLYYMCSRNNNFSNRSQKGVIQADPPLSPGQIAGITIGVVAVVGASAAGFLFYRKGAKFSAFKAVSSGGKI